MYWWQKPSVGDSPSLSFSFSDDIHHKSSGFRKAWSFKSQDCRLILCAKKLRSLSISESIKSSDFVNSVNNLPRTRSDEYFMAPQPLPLPEHPSSSTANVRLPSPPGLREEREKSDGFRRDGHANGEALNLVSGISR